MKKPLLILSLLLLLSFVLWIRFGLYHFLVISKPIPSRTALVEEWLPAYSLEDLAASGAVNRYDTLLIPGSLREMEAFRWNPAPQATKFTLHHASVLVFDSLQATDTLTLRLSGTSANGYFPHFSLWLGDSLTGSFFVGGEDADYHFTFASKRNQSAHIIFDNDIWLPEGDRNVRIRYVKRNNTYCQPEKIASRPVRLPTITARYLHDLGVTHPRTITITRMRTPTNKTAHSALLVKDYFREQHQHTGPLMLYSVGYHSRRTRTTYQRVLPEITWGIRSLPNRLYTSDNWYKSKTGIYRMADEAASLVVSGFLVSRKGHGGLVKNAKN